MIRNILALIGFVTVCYWVCGCQAARFERAIAERGFHQGRTADEWLRLYRDQRIWTKGEIAMATAATLCTVLDVVSTDRILSDGGSEQNPVYGDGVSTGVLVSVKTPLLLVLLDQAHARPFERKAILGGYGAVQCGIAAWNTTQWAK